MAALHGGMRHASRPAQCAVTVSVPVLVFLGMLCKSVLAGQSSAAVHGRAAPSMSYGWNFRDSPQPLRRASAQSTQSVAQRGRLFLRGGMSGSNTEEPNVPGIVDLTGDRRVLKVTTREGIDGQHPVERDEVYLLFNGTIECLDNRSTIYDGKNISGVPFDSTDVGPGAKLPRSFVVGAGNTLPGWELVVRNMSKGERATVFVHSEFGYGSESCTTRSGVFIPPNATLRFDLELLRWNEKDLYNDGGVMVSYSKAEDADRPENDNHPEEHDEVLVRYTGRHAGRVFLSSGASPVWVSLSDAEWARSISQPDALLPRSTLPRGLIDVLTKEATKGGKYLVTLDSKYAYGSAGLPEDSGGLGVGVQPDSSVEFEVELLDWNSLTDRFLDGSVVIKVCGQPDDYFASACRDSAKADLEITGMTSAEGKVFFPTTNLTSVVLGNRVLPEALETALALVREGQRAEIRTGAVRLRDDVARLPYGAALEEDVVWHVRCHGVTRPSKMSVEERMEATRIRKEYGNELFRDKRTLEALDKYEMAYNVIRPQILTGNAQQQVITTSNTEATQLRVDICLNKAACYKRLNRHAEDLRAVIAECSEALELRSTHVRALRRRAEAHLELGDLERASNDIKRGLEVEPDSPPLLQLRARLRVLQRRADAHDQRLFQSMIRKHAGEAAKAAEQPAAECGEGGGGRKEDTRERDEAGVAGGSADEQEVLKVSVQRALGQALAAAAADAAVVAGAAATAAGDAHSAETAQIARKIAAAADMAAAKAGASEVELARPMGAASIAVRGGGGDGDDDDSVTTQTSEVIHPGWRMVDEEEEAVEERETVGSASEYAIPEGANDKVSEYQNPVAPEPGLVAERETVGSASEYAIPVSANEAASAFQPPVAQEPDRETVGSASEYQIPDSPESSPEEEQERETVGDANEYQVPDIHGSTPEPPAQDAPGWSHPPSGHGKEALARVSVAAVEELLAQAPVPSTLTPTPQSPRAPPRAPPAVPSMEDDDGGVGGGRGGARNLAQVCRDKVDSCVRACKNKAWGCVGHVRKVVSEVESALAAGGEGNVNKAAVSAALTGGAGLAAYTLFKLGGMVVQAAVSGARVGARGGDEKGRQDGDAGHDGNVREAYALDDMLKTRGQADAPAYGPELPPVYGPATPSAK